MTSSTKESVPFVKIPGWLFGKSTPDEKAVIGALQYHYPNVKPSLERIADLSGVSKRGVIRILQNLEEKGWIAVFRSPKGKGKTCRNEYVLNVFDVKLANPSSARVAPLGERKPPERAAQQCQGGTVNQGQRCQGGTVSSARVAPLSSARVAPKVDQSKLEQITRKDLEPPFIPPAGERRDKRDDTRPYPDQVEIFGMDSQGSGQAQPQPQQPVKPWEPSPPTPDPEPQPEPLAEAPVKPRARKRKQVFEPTEGDIPARLLPVASELLEFWPTRSGVKTRQAWDLMLTEACKIQNHADGGTEILREQFRQGIKAKINKGKGWLSLNFVRWLDYGTKATTPIMGTGFNRKPTQVESTTAAIAFLNARDAQRAAYANQPAEAESAQYILAEAV